jgi:hypothetical protein
MMRCFFITLFLLVGIAEAQLGVLVKIHSPVPPSDQAALQQAEQSLLQTPLFSNATSTGSNRNLRGDRLLCTTCACLCQGFAPGTCYQVHSKCTGWRRLAEADEEPEASFNIRELQSSTSAECATMKTAVRDAMELAVSTTTEPKIDDASMTCFEIFV